MAKSEEGKVVPPRTIGDACVELSGAESIAEVLEAAKRWPPDLFGLTSVILADSGAYRQVVSPPAPRLWPPDGRHRWTAEVQERAAKWRQWIEIGVAARATEGASPVHDLVEILMRHAAVPLRALELTEQWEALTAIFELHAIADEACAGLGLKDEGDSPLYYLTATNHLLDTGSLSRFPTERLRVLPKTRTPQSGMTLRSLSHHVAVDRCEVDVRWVCTQHPKALDRQMRLRLLVFPWPLAVSPRDFVPVEGRLENMDPEKFGFFEFKPSYEIGDLERRFTSALDEACRLVNKTEIDGVVLPESAVTAAEFDTLWSMANQRGVHVMLAGVRGPEQNLARLRIDTPLGAQTFDQHKHHRWFLESSQIGTYGIEHSLNPARRWWEAMTVRRRRLNVLAFNDWLTVCHLICEDLARIEPVSQLIRAVGPTLVIALLLDGPQLVRRWPGRYATVLADDPGSSVLSVTSLGMALQSRPKGAGAPNRTIALWKDSKMGDREIELDPGATAILLTLWADRVEEFTADGRSDEGSAGRLFLGGVAQVSPPR